MPVREITVALVMSDEQYNISFRRDLVDDKLREWLELISKINNATLDQGRDMSK
jgi:DNA-dependent RNA polymerase auxiliary subunit epsilon